MRERKEGRREKENLCVLSSEKGRLTQHPQHGLAGTLVRVEQAEVSLASWPLQQKPEDRGENRLIIFWDSGRSHMHRGDNPVPGAAMVDAFQCVGGKARGVTGGTPRS